MEVYSQLGKASRVAQGESLEVTALEQYSILFKSVHPQEEYDIFLNKKTKHFLTSENFSRFHKLIECLGIM